MNKLNTVSSSICVEDIRVRSLDFNNYRYSFDVFYDIFDKIEENHMAPEILRNDISLIMENFGKENDLMTILFNKEKVKNHLFPLLRDLANKKGIVVNDLIVKNISIKSISGCWS